MAATNLTSKIFSDSSDLSWNGFVSDSPYGDILQFWQWGETKKLEGWSPLRLGVLKDNKLIIAAQCLLKKAPLLGNYLYIPHGPVFNNTNDLREGLPLLKAEMVKLARQQNCFAVEVEPKIGIAETDLSAFNSLKHFTDAEVIRIFADNGFKESGRNMQPKYKLLYDLTLSEEQLLALMKKNTRYNIRLAERKGVVIKSYPASSPEIPEKVKQFYDLLKETQERAGGYPIRPYKSFTELFDQFKSTDSLVLYEASFNNELIGINITERTSFWSSSFYAASNRLYPEVKAMYLLRWKSVLDAKLYGAKVYDFWGIIPGSSQHAGYSETKLSFGGARIDHTGILALPLNSVKYTVWNRLLPLRAKISELLRR